MKIKVCGMKHHENIQHISTLPIDYMGFIFYKKSPRFIEDKIDFDLARAIPNHIKKTGVFVNEDVSTIFKAIAHYNLDVVQLHGDESTEVCKELKGHVKVMKAFQLDEKFDFSTLENFIPYVDFFLFDTVTDTYGGSGKKFNWDVLNNYNYNVPYFLSGGIDETSAEAIKILNYKQLHAIDINSKFEISPGLKDVQKIQSFIQKLN